MLHVLDDAMRRVAYCDEGQHGGDTFILIHGWGCDHSFFAAQIDDLSSRARVLAPDLCGFGESEGIDHDYSVARFADDIAWFCRSLDLVRPIIIGHSMGGVIALELAGRFADLSAGVMMIDTMVFPTAEMASAIQQIASELSGADTGAALATCIGMLVAPDDDARVAVKLEKALRSVAPRVLHASFVEHLVRYDPSAAASACTVPVAYIGASAPLGNVMTLQAHRPDLRIGQTIGSGHFSPLLVPRQINAMIGDFARLLTA